MLNIKNYEDYFITNDGNVFSKRTGSLIKMKPASNGLGYLQVAMTGNDGKRKRFYVHRIVAEYFVDNPMGYQEVDHVDNDKTNNSHTNLMWCNRSHNQKKMAKNNPHIKDNFRK